MKNPTPIPTQYLTQLHPTKNSNRKGLPACQLSAGSGQLIWWLCVRGHENYRTPRDYIKAQGCTQCKQENNLLLKTHPHIAAEWDHQKNTLNLNDITNGSNHKTHWVCPTCQHSYITAVHHRTRINRPTGCPNCAGKTITPGINDLATTHPILASQYHPTLNKTTTITQIQAGSHKKAWWLGDCGHEWEASIRKRANRNQNCPICAGNVTLKGYNDVAGSHPHLIKEWHPSNPKTLYDYTTSSGYKAKWVCEKKHEWATSISNRTNKGSNCPQCVAGRQTSKTEKELYTYIKDLHPDTINNVRHIINKELDMYIPSKNIAIEYNGVYWHSEASGKPKTYHYDKWLACEEKGIQLIQIWEDDYNKNPELIKTMLTQQLEKLSVPANIPNNILRVRTITKKEADTFLNQNHMQGTTEGPIRLGLTIEDPATGETDSVPTGSLVAVMVLKRESSTLNLLRFSTTLPEIDGLNKLLKVAAQTRDIEKIIIFSDNCINNNHKSYESAGFTVEKILPPDYMLLVKGKRENKSNYQLKRFHDDPELNFEEGLTLPELTTLNNIHRIWDAGKTKWVKIIG